MKVDSKVCWLFLFAVGLMAILLARPILAQEGKVDLTLRLVPGDYYNRVAAGQDNTFFLEIRNTGNKAVTNISLAADKLEGWVIEFSPREIDYLGPGSLQTVDVNIKPDGKAVKGDYRVILIATANEIRKVASIWVRVETASSFWLWVGAIVAFVVVAAFVAIFVRFGRQQNSEP